MFINLVEQLLWYFASFVQFLELVDAVACYHFLARGSFNGSFGQRWLKFIVIFIIIWVHQRMGSLLQKTSSLRLLGGASIHYLIRGDALLIFTFVGLVGVGLCFRLWDAACFIKYSVINITAGSSTFTFASMGLIGVSW